MPELPEVERARRIAAQYFLNKTVKKCCALEQGFACAQFRLQPQSCCVTGGGPREGTFDDIVIEGGDNFHVETLLQGDVADL